MLEASLGDSHHEASLGDPHHLIAHKKASLGDSHHLAAHKKAALANRLSKVLSPEFERDTLNNFSHNRRTAEDFQDGRNDIFYLSPTNANSQVLSKIRPLSPSPPVTPSPR